MNEFVMVPVPSDRVLEVYWYLSIPTPDEEREDGPPLLRAVRAEGSSIKTELVWTPDLLKDQFARSPKSLKAIQRHLAANPGVEYTTDELAEVMNATNGWQSVAGALGAYGRRIKNHYGLPWPFSCDYDEDRGRYVYSMHPENAEVIAAL